MRILLLIGFFDSRSTNNIQNPKYRFGNHHFFIGVDHPNSGWTSVGGNYQIIGSVLSFVEFDTEKL